MAKLTDCNYCVERDVYTVSEGRKVWLGMHVIALVTDCEGGEEELVYAGRDGRPVVFSRISECGEFIASVNRRGRINRAYWVGLCLKDA